MEFRAEAFWTQKSGNSTDEYEDAFCPEALATAPQPSSRVAIADGATESSFSGIWARLLAKSFVDSVADVDDVDALLAVAQPQWAEQVGRRELPWYAEEKAQAGAFSSLLGLALREAPGARGKLRWRAVAIGDSCLIHVRDEKVTARFPLDHSSRFDSSPFLVPSDPRHNEKLTGRLAVTEGDAQSEDSFYLMTDALACWFMTEDESGRRPWEALRDLNTREQRESFTEMVDRLRRVRQIKNDDCTLIRIDVF